MYNGRSHLVLLQLRPRNVLINVHEDMETKKSATQHRYGVFGMNAWLISEDDRSSYCSCSSWRHDT